MIAVLLITVLFVFVSVYFFFRAEKLQRALAVLNRDTAKVQKENQILSKSMALIATNTETFAKNRLQVLLDRALSQETINELTLIKPFVNSYSFIFKACLIKKGVLHVCTKKCFSVLEGDTYNKFFNTIIKKDHKMLRIWNSNNLVAFVTLVEALLVKYEMELLGDDLNKKEEKDDNKSQLAS